MILLLAEPADTAALWLADRLAANGHHRVEVVTPMQLVCSRRMVHRLSDQGSAFEFELVDGRRLTNETVGGVINRVLRAPESHLQRAAREDFRYAQAELHAFLLGWLGSLDCPTLNPADPSCLAGPWRPPWEALDLAANAGLPLAERPSGPADPDSDPGVAAATWFVLDGQLIGRLAPRDLREAILRFAGLWGGRMLQVDFQLPGGRPAFAAASGFVDFQKGGELFVRAISRSLRR